MPVPAAPPSRHDIVAGKVFVVVRMVAAEHEVGAGAALGRHRPLGRAFAHGADRDVGKPRVGLGVAGDERARVVDVDHAAGRRHHPDRPKAARVLGDGGVSDVQEAVIDRAGRDPERGVDRPLGLGRAPRVVGDHLVALDVEVDRDRIGPALDAIVLDHVLKAVFAVREGRELGPHPPLGIVHQVLAGAREDLAAILSDDLADPGDAQVDAADHRPEVAVVLARRAAVGEQQLPDLVDVLAGFLDLDRRHAQALRGRSRSPRRRRHPAPCRRFRRCGRCRPRTP